MYQPMFLKVALRLAFYVSITVNWSAKHTERFLLCEDKIVNYEVCQVKGPSLTSASMDFTISFKLTLLPNGFTQLVLTYCYYLHFGERSLVCNEVTSH